MVFGKLVNAYFHFTKIFNSYQPGVKRVYYTQLLLHKQKYKILAFWLELNNLKKREQIYSYTRPLEYQFEQYSVFFFFFVEMNKFYLSLVFLSKTCWFSFEWFLTNS